jgi:hypothetical protein
VIRQTPSSTTCTTPFVYRQDQQQANIQIPRHASAPSWYGTTQSVVFGAGWQIEQVSTNKHLHCVMAHMQSDTDIQRCILLNLHRSAAVVFGQMHHEAPWPWLVDWCVAACPGLCRRFLLTPTNQVSECVDNTLAYLMRSLPHATYECSFWQTLCAVPQSCTRHSYGTYWIGMRV